MNPCPRTKAQMNINGFEYNFRGFASPKPIITKDEKHLPHFTAEKRLRNLLSPLDNDGSRERTQGKRLVG